jgi:hypothetical protein
MNEKDCAWITRADGKSRCVTSKYAKSSKCRGSVTTRGSLSVDDPDDQEIEVYFDPEEPSSSVMMSSELPSGVCLGTQLRNFSASFEEYQDDLLESGMYFYSYSDKRRYDLCSGDIYEFSMKMSLSFEERRRRATTPSDILSKIAKTLLNWGRNLKEDRTVTNITREMDVVTSITFMIDMPKLLLFDIWFDRIPYNTRCFITVRPTDIQVALEENIREEDLQHVNSPYCGGRERTHGNLDMMTLMQDAFFLKPWAATLRPDKAGVVQAMRP